MQPPNEVIDITNNLLLKNCDNTLIRQEIIEMLKCYLKQNYFEFDGNIFQDAHSLAMGNPLSPLAPEIFLNNLETNIQYLPFFNKFKFWYRYMDDILCCFTGTRRQLDTFFNGVNKLHPNIKFTMEMEQNNSINFLDLTITKSNNKLEFSIFHKPTQTDMVIHNSSIHPYSHKLAAFRCYIHRLINTSMSQVSFKTELNLIKQIAVNNGYKSEIIDQLLETKLTKQALSLEE